jgi:N-acetylglucosamine kinase-like BadF-type ATPase
VFGKKRENLILVVDGGRTHLRAHALTPQGEDRAFLRESGISPVLAEWGSLAERLAGLPEKLAAKGSFHPKDFTIAVAGLAGLDRETDQEQVKQHLARGQKWLRWELESDARQTLRAAAPEGAVAIGILGTGSSFFARDAAGSVFRTGGWGPLLEDFGSGFEFARQAFIAVLRAYDGTGAETAMSEPLLMAVGAESPPDFLRSLYTDAFQPAFWAQFAPVVLREARKGDLVAKDIVDTQIGGVAHALTALMHKAALPPQTPIYLTGGIAKGEETTLEWLRESLSQALPHNPCLILQREAYWGGFELAKRLLSENQ